MSLQKVIDTKKESAQYMVDEITKVIKDFGKRDPGSEGETKAVNYMAGQLEELCDEVKVEPFDVYPASFMGWIFFSVTLMLLSVAFYFIMPLITIVFTIIGLVLMLGQFVFYREMLDKLFKKKTSHNITAVKHPTGEVKRRLFFNGHPDAAFEWTVNNYCGGVAYVAHVLISFVGIVVVFGMAIAAMIVSKSVIAAPTGIMQMLGIINVFFVPFWFLMYWMSNSRVVVDGANDNLTGCYMGIAILKAMKEQGVELENTEVGVIISGSEEAGLRGAKAWCRAHAGEYQDVETLIFAFDTIHEAKHLCVNTKDLNLTVKADPHASDLFFDAAKELNIHCSKGAVPLGATDSAAFNQGGFKATGITGLDHNLQDYYHTRKDTYDNLDIDGLEKCFAVSVKALENFDNGK